MITQHDSHIHKPRIDRSNFQGALMTAKSPAWVAALTVYDYAVANGLDPLFLLAMFKHESSFGTAGVATQTHSWGNTRLPIVGPTEPLTEYAYTQPGQPEYEVPVMVKGRSGSFPLWANWVDGGKSTVDRLVSTTYPIGKAYGWRTIGEVFGHDSGKVWAPAGDLNNPAGYLRQVLDYMNQNADITEAGVVTKPQVTPYPSPNYGYANGVFKPEAIVWHVTAGSGTSARDWLTNPDSQASCNYLIMEDGSILELVNPETRGAAWTNGINYNDYPNGKRPDMSNPLVASWTRNKVNPNLRTIGIEHAGKTGQNVNAKQVDASVRLTAWLCQRFNISPDRTHIIKHAQIDGIDRPNCPGFTEAQWDERVARVASLLQGTGGKVPIAEPQPRTDGAGPIRATFYNEKEPGFGIVVNLKLTAYNPDTKEFYEGEWDMGQYLPWRKL